MGSGDEFMSYDDELILEKYDFVKMKQKQGHHTDAPALY